MSERREIDRTIDDVGGAPDVRPRGQ